MKPSLLILGKDDFPTAIAQRLRGLSAYTITALSSLADLPEPGGEGHSPDLFIVQARQLEDWQICQCLKHWRPANWSYCILVNDRPLTMPAASVLKQQMQLTTQALEAGADSYLWLPDLSRPDSDQGHQNDWQSRLLQAQVSLGLRQVRSLQKLTRINGQLSELALYDALTQLCNRRAFDWELPRRITKARELQEPLSLLMLDVDYFKAVNDAYGHLVGDQVLKQLAEVISHQMRFYESLFRFGGEEFVAILNGVAESAARTIAYRIRRCVGETPFLIDPDLKLAITVSIGVAELRPNDDANGLDLLRRADANLFTAKATGRNCVV